MFLILSIVMARCCVNMSADHSTCSNIRSALWVSTIFNYSDHKVITRYCAACVYSVWSFVVMVFRCLELIWDCSSTRSGGIGMVSIMFLLGVILHLTSDSLCLAM